MLTKHTSGKSSGILMKLSLISAGLLFNGANVISIALSEMQGHFSGYSTSQIQWLITMPPIAMLVALQLSTAVGNRLGRRQALMLGVALYGFCGMLPFFIPHYPVILASRLALSFAIGILNPMATGIISNTYSGNELAGAIGYQSVAVNLGQIGMTFTAGQLVRFGWQYCFLVYGLAFAVLLMVAIFLPSVKVLPVEGAKASTLELARRLPWLTWYYFGLIVFYFLFQMNIYTNLSLTVAQEGLGGAAETGNAMTVMSVASLAVGFLFARLHRLLGSLLHGLAFLFTGIGAAILYIAGDMGAVTAGLVFFGVGFAVIVPYFITESATYVPPEASGLSVSLIIAGSGVGGFLSPYPMNLMQRITGNTDTRSPFLLCAIALTAAAVALLLTCKRYSLAKKHLKKRDAHEQG